MFARPRPAPFAISLLSHGLLLAWVASGPVHEEEPTLYQQAIAPHASKLVWYRFREKLPDVSPTAGRPAVKPPRVEFKLPSQEIVAGSARAPRARQFIWQPAPKVEIQQDLKSPNLLALRAARVEPPARPKVFVPPPEAPKPAAAAPALALLAAAPDVRAAQSLSGAGALGGVIDAPLAKPQRRTYVPPSGGGARPSPFGPAVAEAPALAASAVTAGVSVAIVGLDPTANMTVPLPEGARDARFSAGPNPRASGGAESQAQGGMLYVPGLTIRNGAQDAKPTLMARAAPTSIENLRAAVRGGPPDFTAGDAHPAAVRVAAAPDPMLEGRAVYAMTVQMPNITSFSGSWLIWFAERQQGFGQSAAVSPPVPLRKVDPKYIASAMAERVEGKVRLAAVIRKDGHVDEVKLLRHLDDRLDESAAEAMHKWEFEPALRNGKPVEVDAVIEIPFRLAPKAER
jgi:TonB family protein